MKKLLPLFLIIFIDSFSYFLVIPVFLRLFIHNSAHLIPAHLSLTERDFLFGFTVMLSPVATLIASPIIGHCSDKLGRKQTMSYCLLAAIVGFFLPILGIVSKSTGLVLLGRLIAGISNSSQPIAQAAIADNSEGKQRAFYLSLIAFAMTLAMVLGPLAGSYLSNPQHAFNLSLPYWLGLALAMINLLLLLMLFKDTNHNNIQSFHSQSWRDICHELFKGPVAVFMLLLLLLEIAWSQYYQAIFLFLSQHFSVSTEYVGVFTAYIGIWMCVGLSIIYRIGLLFLSLKQFLLVSFIAIVVGLAGCNYTHTIIMQWIFVAPLAIGIGTAYTSLLAIMSNNTSPQHQGRMLGTARMALGAAWAVTGLLSGTLIAWHDNLPLIFALVIAVITLLLSIRVSRKF